MRYASSTIGIVVLALVMVLLAPAAAMATAHSYEGVTIHFASPRFHETEAFAKYAAEIAEDMGMNFDASWYTFDGTRDKLVLDFRGNVDVWDIIYVDSKWVGEFAGLGLAVPVSDFFEDPDVVDAEFDVDDFMDSQMNVFAYEGEQWAFPLISNSLALVYRTDLFNDLGEQGLFAAEYGYELAPPETYEQFMDVAEFFTREAGEELAGETLESDFYGTVHSNKQGDFLWHDYISYMPAFGADIVYDPETLQPTWNSPENIACGEYYVELAEYQPPGHINMTSGEATGMYTSGKVAMQIEFLPRLAGMIPGTPVEDVTEFALLPTGNEDAPHAYIAAPNAVGISALSPNKEAAYKLMEKVLGKENMKTMALQEPGYQPPRESVLADEDFVEAQPIMATYMQKLMSTDTYAFPHPKLPDYPEAYDIAATSVSKALSGNITVEEAFNEAQEELVRLFEDRGYIE